MRLGSEYLTSNTAIAFPLSSNQEIPETVRCGIVDAHFVVPFGSPLPKLTAMAISGSTCTATVTVGTGASATTETFTDSLSNSGFYVVRSATHCIVFDNTYLAGKDLNFSGSLDFDMKCIDIDTQKVTSLQLVNYVNGLPVTTPVTGDIAIRHGYSTTVTANGGVVISAIPGAGKGYYPCPCEDESPDNDDPVADDDGEYAFRLHTKNGIIKIMNDSCYDIIPWMSTDSHATARVQLINKCVACCTCEQYKERVDRLRELAWLVKEAGEVVMGGIAAHNEAVAKFNEGSGIHTGGVTPQWFATITALKKNPSVGSIRGNLHIRAVATISNTTLCPGEIGGQISDGELVGDVTFECQYEVNGETHSVPFEDVRWFMLGAPGGGGAGVPAAETRVDPGKTIKITGTCTIPGTIEQITAVVSGSAKAVPQTGYSCEDAEFEAHYIC